MKSKTACAAEYLSRKSEKGSETITAESRLIEDLKADSLDIVELIMDLEQDFGVEIPDDDLPNIKTIGDIVNYLEK